MQIFEPLSAASSGVPVTLFWADPLGRAANDYDLYLFNADSNVVAFSQDVQDGNDDPYELLVTPRRGWCGSPSCSYRGADRYFQLSALRGRFKDSTDGLVARRRRASRAATRRPSTRSAPPRRRRSPPLPVRPRAGRPDEPDRAVPGAFTGQQLPERFTSDGPRRVFFNADGTPITPGNFSSTGGAVRQKPDITAADGVNTSVSGFRPFFGTSAAAPHAAAIAGLVLSGNPGAETRRGARGVRGDGARPAPAGVDGRTGHGVIRADRVLEYTGATPQPLVRAGTPTVTRGRPATATPTSSRARAATLTLPVTNVGDGTATGVSVDGLDGGRRGVTITPRARSYGTSRPGRRRPATTRSRSRPTTRSASASGWPCA